MSIKKIEKEFQMMVKDANPHIGRVGLVYVRVSSKRQETEGHGRESQDGRCKTDLENIGVPFARSFPDTYSGGGDFMNRPAMRAMLAYIDANPHKKFVVVFDDLKRFARDTVFHLKLRSAFKARDVLVRCLNYNFDDSPEGMFVETVLAAGNELERHQNRRQVIQKMKERLERGYWPFGAKRGYDMIKDPVHGKILVANKEGLTILKKALEDFATGSLLRNIDVARFLFSKGFWKKRSAEKYLDEVAAILKDVIHCGDLEYHPWDVPRRKGIHKGVISYETYDLIQKRLKKDVAGTRIRLDVSSDFPLRSLILCEKCNQKITGAWHKKHKYAYYYCSNKDCQLCSKTISKDKIEREFSALIRHNRLKDDMDDLVKLIFDRVWHEEVRDLKQQQVTQERGRQSLEEKIHDLSELARTTKLDAVRRVYEKQIEEIANDLERAQESRAKKDFGVPYRTALEKSTQMLKNPMLIWEKVGVTEKHRLFFFLFEARLVYSKIESFRTANSLSSTRIFEEFCDQNSDDVDLISHYSNILPH